MGINNFFNENKGVIAVVDFVVAVVALIFSYNTYNENTSLQEKIGRLNTYNMDLNYTIEYPNLGDEGYIWIDENNFLNISDKFYINPVPQLGGIKEFHVLQYEDGNIESLVSVNSITEEDINTADAPTYFYSLGGMLNDKIYINENINLFYLKLFFVIEDYNCNFYTNLVILEFERDTKKIDIRIYDEMDLLYLDNTYIKNLPNFDDKMMYEYLEFRNNLKQLLKN